MNSRLALVGSCANDGLAIDDNSLKAIEIELERFETAWQSGEVPDIATFVRDADKRTGLHTASLRRRLMIELVATDLERRWHAAALNPQCRLDTSNLPSLPKIEDYLSQLPQLESHGRIPIDLVVQEFQVRHLWGDRPDVTEFTTRFKSQSLEVARELVKVRGERLVGMPIAGPASPAEGAKLPESIGRFVVREVLGDGSFGIVYRAYDPELNRDIAIKVPRAERVAAFGGAEAYLAEARNIASLDAPGIVPVYDLGRTEKGSCYTVSKLVAGGNLAQRLDQGRPSLVEAVEWIAQVADALHHAHEHGLVHRDVKPANILLDAEGRALIADFGMALRDEEVGVGTGYAGTLNYMSPEQARKQSHLVDCRSDVFSLGVVLFELLTGRLPYRGTSRTQLVSEITSCEPRPARQLNPAVPEALDRICQKARELRPSQRYATANEFAVALRAFARRRQSGNRSLRRLIAVTAFVAAIGTASWLQLRSINALSITKNVQLAAPYLDLYLQPRHDADTLPRNIGHHDIPLRAGDQVFLDVQLRDPAFVYVMEYSEGRRAALLWPADLSRQHPTSRVCHDSGAWPEITFDGPPRRVMLVAGVSARPLDAAALDHACEVVFSLASEIAPSKPLVEFLYPADPQRPRLRAGNPLGPPIALPRLNSQPQRELQKYFQAFAAQVFYYGSMDNP